MTASTRRTGRPRSADFTTPLTIPGGAVAGAEIVRELPPEVALPAWQALRSVLMWAAEEPGQRSDLFEPCAMADWERELLEAEWEPDLRVPLAVLIGELSRPSQAAPDAIAHACLCVADWALENNGVATALAFAEAAALAWPQNPRYAWMAGRLLRTQGRVREAEQWLKRAARAASSSRDSDAQTLALNSLGNLYYEIGSYQQAATTHQQALRTARKRGLREREGEILHDLFVATWYLGRTEEAGEYARAAFEIYKFGHPRLAGLAHDVAFSWVAEGHYARALTVLIELPSFFQSPRERVRVLASVARAAGGCGNREVFADVKEKIWSIAEAGSGPGVGAALVELARGATSLEEWDLAERALTRASEIAQKCSESDVLIEAEEALRSVQAHRAAAPVRNHLDGGPFPRLDAFATGFVMSLRAGAQVVA